ncbi:type II toxin-antitoxin system RelE/ParE family toxin [Fimbriiglobus ruber]|uniref:Death on curing protein, Doc toxin n=1 Tax=Fimbriiglobus ruber TaxID=1908690 RepID=A0A225DNN3_9BACT|nr:type II toxin-antitoxin system RelE/ParE family toxin [Fimbriiglobus ruber]OWK42931.1 hypothetical protein FRUB_02528 [Fimbriiglobus ruber]
MSFTVVLLPRAKADIRTIGEWFGKPNKSAEARWRKRILQAVDALTTDPVRYPLAEDAMDLGLDLRELIVGRRRGIAHRILFTIDDQTVHVLRVRHASQDRLSDDDL